MPEYEISGLPIDISAQADKIKPGAIWGFSWDIYNTNDVLENTTGWTATCQFRETPEAETALLSLSVGSGITNNNGGTFELSLTATQTGALKVKQVYFDIYVNDGTYTECMIQGIIPVLWRATRS